MRATLLFQVALIASLVVYFGSALADEDSTEASKGSHHRHHRKRHTHEQAGHVSKHHHHRHNDHRHPQHGSRPLFGDRMHVGDGLRFRAMDATFRSRWSSSKPSSSSSSKGGASSPSSSTPTASAAKPSSSSSSKGGASSPSSSTPTASAAKPSAAAASSPAKPSAATPSATKPSAAGSSSAPAGTPTSSTAASATKASAGSAGASPVGMPNQPVDWPMNGMVAPPHAFGQFVPFGKHVPRVSGVSYYVATGLQECEVCKRIILNGFFNGKSWYNQCKGVEDEYMPMCLAQQKVLQACPEYQNDWCYQDLGGSQVLRSPCPPYLLCHYCLGMNPLHCSAKPYTDNF